MPAASTRGNKNPMAKSPAGSRRSPAVADRSQSLAERLRPWLLAVSAALLVARPLLPSESTAFRGDDLPFALGWLLLGGVWLAATAAHGDVRWRFGAVDAALFALVACSAVSALAALPAEAPRPTINTLWVWIGAGASFFVLRQTIRNAREVRALLAVMVGLAVALAAYGFFQYFITLPATREAYAADPDGMLRSIHQWYPPGSPQRMLFEQRLASSQPLATFALANSLAGVLATWLIVGLAIWGAMGRTIASARGAAAGLALLAIGGCLVLTQSRSGYVATAVGTAALAWWYGIARTRYAWKIALAGVTVVALFVVGGIAVGSLDAEVLREAPKSFGYRVQYWQASARMIGDRPWLGVGPGNFKDRYTRYKAETASEEISDPHNFLVEVAATAGLPAALAFVAMLVTFARQIVVATQAPTHHEDDRTKDAAATRGAGVTQPECSAARHIVGGGVSGFALAAVMPILVGPVLDVPLSPFSALSGMLLAGAVVKVLWRWIAGGSDSSESSSSPKETSAPGRSVDPILPAIGAAVLLVHLLTSGGISYPGVSSSLWLLMAVALVSVDLPSPGRLVSKPVALVGAAICLSLAVACYATGYRPVTLAYRHMALGRAEPRAFEEHYLAATEADPYGDEAWRDLANWRFERWQQVGGPIEPALEAQREWLARRPHSADAWGQAGQWLLALFVATGERHYGDEAVEAFERGVELYPHSAAMWAHRAIALDALGRRDEALQAAAEARRLDEITPHLDRKLTDELRHRLPRPD